MVVSVLLTAELYPGPTLLLFDEELLLVELLLEAPVPGPVRLTPELELPELLELPGPLLLALLELLEFEFPDTPGPVKLVSEELLPADPLTPGPPEE